MCVVRVRSVCGSSVLERGAWEWHEKCEESEVVGPGSGVRARSKCSRCSNGVREVGGGLYGVRCGVRECRARRAVDGTLS